MRLLITAVLLGSLLTITPAADASGRGVHYGMNAKKVAKRIGCHGIHRPKNTAAPKFRVHGVVVCRIKSRRVNVITFDARRGETLWEDYILTLADAQGYPEHWASASGVAVVAKNGNRGAACAGKRALRGARNVGAYRATGAGWSHLRC